MIEFDKIDVGEIIPLAHMNNDDVEVSDMQVPIPEGGQHLATLAVFNVGEDVVAFMRMVDDEGSFIPIPPHMAAQLPMVMQMMKAQANA